MLYSPKIDKLIETLRCLPGVGPRSAQRMAFHLLERNREGGKELATALDEAMSEVKHCQRCRNFCEADVCHICSNPKRDRSTICIVESPADIIAIEHTNNFRGLYFVLMGHLSPLDGMGPNEIGIDQLKQQLAEEMIEEVILATNSTVEGEATAHYIAELVKDHKIKVTRLAQGVSMGSELEYTNERTIALAFTARAEV
tara:strand:+ start:9151 stop:9747 length:597 start_codon:yes stop_codon:yes gene_type:complete